MPANTQRWFLSQCWITPVATSIAVVGQIAVTFLFFSIRGRFPINSLFEGKVAALYNSVLPTTSFEHDSLRLLAAFLVTLLAIACLERLSSLAKAVTVAITLLVVLSTALAAATFPVTSLDTFYYLAYGRELAVLHANPYKQPLGDFVSDPIVAQLPATWLKMRCAYGPVSLAVFTGINFLSDKLWVMLGVLKATWLVCYLITAFLFHEVLRGLGATKRIKTCTFAVMGNPMTMWYLLIDGHSEILGFVGLFATWLFLQRKQFAVAGFLFGAAVASKLPLLAALPFVALALWRTSVVSTGVKRIGRELSSFLKSFTAITIIFLVCTRGAEIVVLRQSNLLPNLPGLVAFLIQRVAMMFQKQPLDATALTLLANTIGNGGFAIFSVWFMTRARRLSTLTDAMHFFGVFLTIFILSRNYVQPWYYFWTLPILAATNFSTRSFLVCITILSAGFALCVKNAINLNITVIASSVATLLVNWVRHFLPTSPNEAKIVLSDIHQQSRKVTDFPDAA